MTPAQKVMDSIDELGWTQREAAAILEVTPGTVTRWRNQARRDAGEEVNGECSTPHRGLGALVERIEYAEFYEGGHGKPCYKGLLTDEWHLATRARVNKAFNQMHATLLKKKRYILSLLGGDEVTDEFNPEEPSPESVETLKHIWTDSMAKPIKEELR